MSTVSRRRLDLPVEGMTCASCAARIERRLSRLDGVSASVNYATERATVTFDPSDHDLAEIAAAIEQAGYHAVLPAKREEQGDQRHDAAMLRMAVAVVLAVPVAAISMVSSLQFDGWQWLALALTTPVVLWAGWPFHRVALRNVRHGTASMDTLVSLGTLTAYLWSLYALTLGDAGELSYRMPWEWTTGVRQQGAEHIYLEVAAVVTALILVGRAMEARAKRHAGAALRSLLELGAKDVATLRDGTERRVPIAELRSGDLFAVRPGETVATDGVVVDGRSAVDASLLTGESTPVEVGPGDGVTGGSVNQGGALTVRATAVGADTALARIARLVAEAQSGKAPSQRLADRVSAIFVPLVIALSAATLGFWIADGADASFAVEAAAAVLIVACPCALGLATPTALLVGTGRGAQLGVVIRGPEVLEQSRRITAVVLDKTGTLTEGRMSVSGVDPAAGASRADVLRLAGAVAHASEHPVARAIAAQARREIGELPAAGDVRQTPGLGVEAVVEGRRIAVGRGNGATAVTADGNPVGSIRLEDRIARTSAEAVSELEALGVTPVLLTGDHEETARAVAGSLGIERYLAEVLPEGKVAEVARLQAAGEVVAMVGDGVNDAPALAQADLGIAIGTGSDAAIEAADITLVSGDLRGVADAIRLARATLITIRENLLWAFAYNAILIPLAMAGRLNPILAGAAMAGSSLLVVANSLRLRRFSSPREEAPR